ncbi:MAG: germination protein YpeB [Clostridia bacterium]|nr:germination protein YpeB [Clostridia bacterium]
MLDFFSKKIEGRGGAFLAFVLAAVLVAICVFLKIENNRVVETLESSYTKSFYDLVEYMDDTETLLAKVQISNSPDYAAKTLSDIWRKADLAQSSLAQIPITHISLEKVVQFLNQLSDYSYTLSQGLVDGKTLTDEEFENIKNYYERCKNMNQTLNQLINDMASGSISWEELTKSDDDAFLAQEVSNVSQDSFSSIEENMQDYEGLIYDGPFSEHMTSVEPLGLGTEKYTVEQATEKIYEFVDKSTIKEIVYNEVTEATIPVYSFEVTLIDNSQMYIDVTIQGGEVLWCMSNRTVTQEKITIDEAKDAAKKFLESHEIYDMQDTYYISENAMATINFAYVDGDIVCYSDLIKVKVSLEDGTILGMEAQSYYSSHTQRTYNLPKVSMEEARKRINPDVDIYYEGLALIPTDWRSEILTYEFKGKVEENDFIVYINVETGKEEKIYMIVDTPNGVLTV